MVLNYKPAERHSLANFRYAVIQRVYDFVPIIQEHFEGARAVNPLKAKQRVTPLDVFRVLVPKLRFRW